MFNSQNQQNTTQQNGGLFGSSAAKPPLFGNTQATTNTTTPSFSKSTYGIRSSLTVRFRDAKSTASFDWFVQHTTSPACSRNYWIALRYSDATNPAAWANEQHLQQLEQSVQARSIDIDTAIQFQQQLDSSATRQRPSSGVW